jgi:hypothetical protein
MYGLYDFLSFVLRLGLLGVLASVLIVLLWVDRKQTLGFLPRGVPEANAFARWAMGLLSNERGNYIPGARPYFSLCFAAVAAIVAFGLLVPALCWLAECALLAWLLLQARTVWTNHRKGY